MGAVGITIMKTLGVIGVLLCMGCSACEGELMGSDDEPQCVVCTEHAPHWVRCRSVRIASGGQAVCETPDGVVLCQRVRDCPGRSP